MPDQTTYVAVEDLVPGDVLAMTSDDDPNPQRFRVAHVEHVNTVAYGDEPRVVLTSEPRSPGAAPMVLAYPRGTKIRKVIG
ncbi:hypothetical protein [Mycolicibacterium parafortuitum]|uniref:Uncharacterized protein n=1 Tax=Mycolicibacterium parafortuitum TaxID=39692 RepID=A0A375YE11_MYCPF|nr:hypothetical protein [Mycolicibacterium parafortuitum]ORB29243.1 hypothetical protein BST38_16150 [Mycolicibacterium parafortuitum]SRX79365.1 hypothetical protein MPP7335_01102 [Mycolicibacterium parafortuitum]